MTKLANLQAKSPTTAPKTFWSHRIRQTSFMNCLHCMYIFDTPILPPSNQLARSERERCKLFCQDRAGGLLSFPHRPILWAICRSSPPIFGGAWARSPNVCICLLERCLELTHDCTVDFEQPWTLWTKAFDDTAKNHYVSNVAGHLGGVKSPEIKARQRIYPIFISIFTIFTSSPVSVYAAINQELSWDIDLMQPIPMPILSAKPVWRPDNYSISLVHIARQQGMACRCHRSMCSIGHL